jgi:hypothetical protein
MSADLSRFCIDSLAFARRMLEKAGVVANPAGILTRRMGNAASVLCAGRYAGCHRSADMVGGVAERG